MKKKSLAEINALMPQTMEMSICLLLGTVSAGVGGRQNGGGVAGLGL